MSEQVDLSPFQLMNDLAVDARAIDAAAERLGQRVKQYQGAKDGDIGVRLRWEAAIDEMLLTIEGEMLSAATDADNKLPASLKARSSRMMEAEARIRVKGEQPELWVEYAEMAAEISALEKWIRAKERSSSLRQSILSSQKVAG